MRQWSNSFIFSFYSLKEDKFKGLGVPLVFLGKERYNRQKLLPRFWICAASYVHCLTSCVSSIYANHLEPMLDNE